MQSLEELEKLRDGDSSRTLTERQAFADILVWAATRPVWQQDALRRLVQKGSLQQQDIDELAALCLDPTLPHQSISDAHVTPHGAAGESISVLRIENPTGINALAPDQKLEFGRVGLSIVYGDNGSGKSGYVRVLKHACRCRDGKRRILQDVEEPARTPQSAKIVFVRGAIEEEYLWTPDGPNHAHLPSVGIFDSRSANVHVEKTNAVAYTPQPMEVLEALASACDEICKRLNAQRDAITAKTPLAIKMPRLSADTAAGAFVHRISAKSSIAQLTLLAHLSEEETRRLATLEADLAQAPGRAAEKIIHQKTRLDNFCTKLEKAMMASSSAAFAARDALKSDWENKAEAARLASDALFTASPLPDIGKATWVNLWEAARKYSDTAAYPDKTFPDPQGEDELCVLCQQPLSHEAVARRMTFETFVKGTIKAEEEAAKKAYREAIQQAKRQHLAMASVRQLSSLISVEVGNKPLATQVRECAVRTAWRLRALVAQCPAPGEAAAFPESGLTALSNDLAGRATLLSADQNSPHRARLVKEYHELRDREALGPLLADVKAEIERCKESDAITRATKSAAKRAVTTKNKELSDQLVTNALRGRFAREIEKLKLSRMPIELRKIKDANAVSYFQVCLVEKPDEPVGDIFSEGEHRCVALAAFLAELVTSKQYSAIVFDDPMSSLDHIHRKAVAARLIEESEHRQVIVFTHDLAFLFELRREAEAKDRPVQYQTVVRRQSRPGFIEGELPMKGKSAQQLTVSLRSELKRAQQQQFDKWSDAKRTLAAKGFIGQLRDTWDQGIADFIFPVLGRFENVIKGGSLFKLAVINEQDVKIVTEARGRLSEGLHPSALNPETVTHGALLGEIVKLETWLASITQRQKDARAPVTSFV